MYVTNDYGKSWKNITRKLPEKYSVYVIKEDYIDENLLFVGTEESVYFSKDKGNSWEKLGKNLPTVAILMLEVMSLLLDLLMPIPTLLVLEDLI